MLASGLGCLRADRQAWEPLPLAPRSLTLGRRGCCQQRETEPPRPQVEGEGEPETKAVPEQSVWGGISVKRSGCPMLEDMLISPNIWGGVPNVCKSSRNLDVEKESGNPNIWTMDLNCSIVDVILWARSR